jgi:protein-disulfide isomerase
LVDEVLADYPSGVQHVFKQFPLTQIHPHAMHAAKASIAAQKQGKFWEFHEVLFENYRALQPEKVQEYAKAAGLDMQRFERDLAAPETQKQVDEDMRLARATGVRGTPTLFVGGKRLMNRSKDGFKAMIDPELKK